VAPKPETRHSIFLIAILHNLLQSPEKFVVISHLNPFEFFWHDRKQRKVTRGENQANRVGVACGPCHVLRANLLKPALCELSNYRDESQIVFDAAIFFEEKLVVQVE
jgi:hypothetical protein